jgi:hypothetical protein
VKTSSKVVYIFLSLVLLVGFTYLIQFSPLLLGILFQLLIGAAWILGARSFRVASEDVNPPRPWWRFTGRPAASLILGILFVLNTIFDIVASFSLKGPAAATAVEIVVSGLLAVGYLYSWSKLRQGVPR